MKWSKTVHFSATVHHGIILPSGQGLDNHLKKMNGLTPDDGDIIFELWGCFASLSEDDTYPPNEMNLSDGGALSSWDMRRERSCKHERVNAWAQERLLGTAKVLQRSLFHLISARQPSAPEVK
ncbi:hypothetical protein Mapa_006571 [Marchantia paleacea]|nr:hypothetical protein Mapa_006571 [Marchantia paleacea]